MGYLMSKPSLEKNSNVSGTIYLTAGEKGVWFIYQDCLSKKGI